MARPDTFSLPPRAGAALGLPIERLCARAGVTPATAWSTEQFFAVWAAADAELGDRAAGLRFGAGGIDGGYGVAAIVALHAPGFRAALAALARYKRLTCPELIEVDIAGEEVRVRYHWLQATGPVPRLLVDTVMASLAALARRGSGGRVAPIRVELARPPADAGMLSEHFGCPIIFGAVEDAMVFARAALDVPFATADAGAFAAVVAGLEARLVAGEGFGALVDQMRVAIARQLAEGRPASVAAVAHRLGLSGRTLQRRLDGERTSFQHQLAAVRRVIARRLLLNTELDPVAIAMLLGFAEPNSFARAFRGWERTTPMRWRARQETIQ